MRQYMDSKVRALRSSHDDNLNNPARPATHQSHTSLWYCTSNSGFLEQTVHLRWLINRAATALFANGIELQHLMQRQSRLSHTQIACLLRQSATCTYVCTILSMLKYSNYTWSAEYSRLTVKISFSEVLLVDKVWVEIIDSQCKSHFSLHCSLYKHSVTLEYTVSLSRRHS